MPTPFTLESLRAAIDAASAETAQYEASVAVAQDRLRRHLAKIEKMRELVVLHEPDEVGPFIQPMVAMTVGGVVTDRSHGIEQSGNSRVSSRPTSKKAQIDRAISEMLTMRGVAHRGEILTEMIRRGLMGHEKDPLAALAAFLSNSRDKYTPDGRGNFSLKTSVPTEPPPAPTGMGSAEARPQGAIPGPPSTALENERSD